MTLHIAIEKILKEIKNGISFKEIAGILNEKKWFIRNDHKPLDAKHIRARINNYPLLFEYKDQLLYLKKVQNNIAKTETGLVILNNNDIDLLFQQISSNTFDANYWNERNVFFDYWNVFFRQNKLKFDHILDNNDNVIIAYGAINKYLFFEDCHFEGDGFYNSIRLHSIKLQNNYDLNKEKELSNYLNLSLIVFYKCTFSSVLTLNDFHFNYDYITLPDGKDIKKEIVGSFLFVDSNLKSIRFDNSTIHNLKFKRCSVDRLEVCRSEFTYIKLHESEVEEFIIFNEETKIEHLSISHCGKIKEIKNLQLSGQINNVSVLNSNFQNFVTGQISSINTIRFYKVNITIYLALRKTKINIIKTQNCTFNEVIFGDLTIGNLDINKYTYGTFEITNCKFFLIDFLNKFYNKEVLIRISDSKIKHLLFDNFDNSANFKISNVNNIFEENDFDELNSSEIISIFDELNKTKSYNTLLFIDDVKLNLSQSYLILKNSNFKETCFIDFPLHLYTIYFQSSNLQGLSLLGRIEYQNVCFTKDTSIEQKLLFFNQLKKVLENQGDAFKSYEVKAKVDDLELERLKQNWNSLAELKSKRTWDIINLWLNKKTNDHTLNYIKPFLLILLVPLLLYLPYLFCLSRLFINTNLDWNLFGYYFEFINPTHRLDFLEKRQISGWAIFFDVFNRMIVGYLIYQFIAAFRRLGKK